MIAAKRRYFHRTSPTGAAAILKSGFRDSTGIPGTTFTKIKGVFLSDVPLDCNEGTAVGPLLQVELPGDCSLDEFEIVEEGKPYREWIVPARLVNKRGTVRQLTEDEEDKVRS